jgi:hypothetical protein
VRLHAVGQSHQKLILAISRRQERERADQLARALMASRHSDFGDRGRGSVARSTRARGYVAFGAAHTDGGGPEQRGTSNVLALFHCPGHASEASFNGW